jgi:type IV fimbrial biogenesis protein FimT
VTSNPLKLSRRRQSRGYTLIELMVVVIIIGITAALASPLLLEQMRERKSRDMAQQIAMLYTSARLRAMGRGNAVMVRYNATTGFQVVESIEGSFATGATNRNVSAECAPTPGAGCLVTDWATDSQVVNRLMWPTTMTVNAVNSGGTAVADMSICFSPGGRSFASFAAGADPAVAMVGSVRFTVQRAGGLARKVAVLPNGYSRIAL